MDTKIKPKSIFATTKFVSRVLTEFPKIHFALNEYPDGELGICFYTPDDQERLTISFSDSDTMSYSYVNIREKEKTLHKGTLTIASEIDPQILNLIKKFYNQDKPTKVTKVESLETLNLSSKHHFDSERIESALKYLQDMDILIIQANYPRLYQELLGVADRLD